MSKEDDKKPTRIVLGGMPAEFREMFMGGDMSPFEPSITNKAPVADYTRSLISLAAAMDMPPDYAVGDIVVFKVGLNHTRLSDAMIVREIMSREDAVRANPEDVTTSGYCDLQNVKVGVIVNNGHYHEFMVNGQRIQKQVAD